MKQISTYLCMGFLAIIIASCSTSQNTVGGSLQKRKYTKGFYHNRKTSLKDIGSRDKKEELIVANEAIRTTEATQVVPAAEDQTAQNAALIVVTETQDAASSDKATPKEQEYESRKSPGKKKGGAGKKSPGSSASARLPKNSKYEYYIPVKERSFAKKNVHGVSAASGGVNTVLLVILALFVPWLSILLYEGATGRFWLDLVVWLLGFLGLAWSFAYLLFLFAIIYAILIVLGVI